MGTLVILLSTLIMLLTPEQLVLNGQSFNIEPQSYVLDVTTDPQTFSMMSYVQDNLGGIGLVAHHEISGHALDSLKIGSVFELRQGTQSQYFRVVEINRYQAIPGSTMYSYINLDTGKITTDNETFYENFFRNKATLMTCIPRSGNLSWGRIFYIAVPIT